MALKPHATIPNAYTEATRGLQGLGAAIGRGYVSATKAVQSLGVDYAAHHAQFQRDLDSGKRRVDG